MIRDIEWSSSSDTNITYEPIKTRINSQFEKHFAYKILSYKAQVCSYVNVTSSFMCILYSDTFEPPRILSSHASPYYFFPSKWLPTSSIPIIVKFIGWKIQLSQKTSSFFPQKNTYSTTVNHPVASAIYETCRQNSRRNLTRYRRPNLAIAGYIRSFISTAPHTYNYYVVKIVINISDIFTKDVPPFT